MTFPSLARRVVVTGLGAVTPIGANARATWTSLLAGKSGVGKITRFDASNSSVQIAAEIHNFDPTTACGPLFHPKEIKKVGRFTHLAVAAGVEAYADSGLDASRSQIAPECIGTNFGVGMGGLPEIESIHNDFLEKGFRRITPFFTTQVIPNMASGQLSILFNFKGPNLCNVSACASSAHAIGESFRHIQLGVADIMLTGGAESVISPLGIGGFASMRALSTRNSEPEKASRPFDADRDGFVMAEGAAALVLEEYEHAKKRGARIYAEVVGYGLSGDAHHITQPAPDQEGGFRAMKMALQVARALPEQVGYVNAHGTSTPAGDAEEAGAIARLFPNGKKHLHVSSTKSMTGHLLGASGAAEALFSVLAIYEGKIPPTINLDRLDPRCAETGLDFTAHHSVEKQVEYALSNSFGFGGTNASLIFRRI